MPSFTFLDPNSPGSRFSNNMFGAYYATKELDTAIAETVFHQEKFLLDANITKPLDVDYLIVLADITGNFHDIRNQQAALPTIYSMDDYSASQTLALNLKAQGSYGILYTSVRQSNGINNANNDCIAVLRPPVISNIRDGERIVYKWNGKRIVGRYRKSDYQPI